MRRQAIRIHNLVDYSVVSDLSRIAEEPDERIIDVALKLGALRIVAGIRRPTDDLVLIDVIALSQVVAICGAALGHFF